MNEVEYMVEDFTNFFRKFYETVGTLKLKFPEEKNLEDIYQVIEILENKPSDNEVKKAVNALQRTCNKLYDKYGMSDEILSFQVAINKVRNYKDVTDESEIINHAPDGDFVQ